MKRPALINELCVALVISVGAYLLFPVVFFALGAHVALKLVISLAACIYIWNHLGRSDAKAGRGVLAIVTVVVLTVLVCYGAILTTVAAAVALIWLTRTLMSYSSLSGVVADAFVTAASLGAGMMAAARSGSLSTGLWTFLLVQSLWILIPAQGLQRAGKSKLSSRASGCRDDEGPEPSEVRFTRAKKAAEEALRVLYGQA